MYTFEALQHVEPDPIVRRIWRLTFVIFVFLVLLLFLPWQQTVKGQGELIAFAPSERVAPVTATIDGMIEAYHVTENQRVKAGDKLFTMIDLDRDYAARIEAELAQLHTQITNLAQEITLLRSRREDTHASITVGMTLFDQRAAQTEAQLRSLRTVKEARQTREAVQQRHFERVAELYAASIESRRSYDEADAARQSAKAELEQTLAQIAVEERRLQMIAQEKTQFASEAQIRLKTLENSLLAAQNRHSALDRERQRQLSVAARYERSTVYADKNGTVLRILLGDKDRYVGRGEPVIRFAPDVTQRALLFRVTDFNMPLVHEDLNVRIKYYGWPALQISGWPIIRFGTFAGIIRKVDPVAHEPGFYYAYVFEDPAEPWPDARTLRVGTQATVWVALETVPVWYQIWRLMNAFPPKMVIPKEAE